MKKSLGIMTIYFKIYNKIVLKHNGFTLKSC